MKNSPDRNSSHLAGEYFVAAELYRLGYSVGITMGNAKAIDILAEKDGHAVAVQVKAIREKKSSGWPIMRDQVKKDVIYVFVLLNQPKQKADYFIATSEEARAKVKQYATRGIIDISSINSDDFRERWDKLEGSKKF
jgi:predicted AAA+ superfamily ATPase